MADSAARRCTPFLLVLYPLLVPSRWTEETYPYRDIHAQVAAAARNAGLEVLDLTPAFGASGREWRTWWGTSYDSHPGAEAQALAARTMAQFIKDHRLLESGVARRDCSTRVAPGQQ